MLPTGGVSRAALVVACLAMIGPAVARAENPDEFRLVDGRIYSVNQTQPPAADATQPAPATQPSTPRPRGPSAPQPSAQARSFGGARGPQSSAPSMIGDFFGSPPAAS